MSLITADSLIWASSEQLLRPLLFPGPLLDQGAPVPAQVPQLPLPGWRHERRAQHPPLGQLAQPHGIQPVGLRAAGYVPVVAGVDHPALDGVFEQVKRRFPVARGGLHHAQGHSLANQPVPQFQQRPGRGGERAHFLPPPPGLLSFGTRTHATSDALPISSAATRATSSAASSVCPPSDLSSCQPQPDSSGCPQEPAGTTRRNRVLTATMQDPGGGSRRSD